MFTPQPIAYGRAPEPDARLRPMFSELAVSLAEEFGFEIDRLTPAELHAQQRCQPLAKCA